MCNFLTVLLECSASMSVLALCFTALTPLLSKRYSSKWLYYSWIVIIAGFIVPFRPQLGFSIIKAGAAPISAHQQAAVIANTAGTSVQAVTPGHAFVQISPYDIACIIWLAGAVVSIVLCFIKQHRFIKLLRRYGSSVDDVRTLNLLKIAKIEVGVKKQVKISICPYVKGPMTTCLKSPVIVLPCSGFKDSELSSVLKHELVHIKRKDLVYKSLVILASAIHWFNPVIYIAAKQIASQCEISCDTEAIKGIGLQARVQYGENILKVAKSCLKAQTPFSTNFYGGKREMKKRLSSIMDTKKKKAGAAVLCLVFAAALISGAVFAENKNTVSSQNTHQTSTVNLITNAAQKWAEAVKARDGKAQFGLLSPKCQSAGYEKFSLNYWVTGMSSPWVESYSISAGKNSAMVTFKYATSTGFAGYYEQELSFVEQNGKFYIDSFSDPKLKEDSAESKNGTEAENFLNSPDGHAFKSVTDTFVKSYVIGDISTMKTCLLNPESSSNHFTTDSTKGKYINYKSLTLKLDAKDIKENDVTAEYKIALADTGKNEYLHIGTAKSGNKWKIKNFWLEE